MARREKLIQLWGKTILIVGGAMLASYSWVSTFADVPPIIKDWRAGIGIGLFLLFIGVTWTIYDLLRKYVWWAEPEIILTPHVKDDSISPLGERMVFALLTVYNNEERAITDCYATLEQATNLYGGDLIPIELGKKERLKWAEAKYSTDDCKITIASKSEMRVHVANISFHFAFCKESFHEKTLQGIYIIRIRIDGKLNGNDIKPQFFDGHLLMDRIMDESGHIVTRMVFSSGDWTQNKDIPKWYREGKAVNDKNNKEN